MASRRSAPQFAPAPAPPALQTTHANISPPETPPPSHSTPPTVACVRFPQAAATAKPPSPDSPPPPPKDFDNTRQSARPLRALSAKRHTETPVQSPPPAALHSAAA